MSKLRFCIVAKSKTDSTLDAYRRRDGKFVLNLRSEEAETFDSYAAASAKLAELRADPSVPEAVRHSLEVAGYGWQPAPGYKVADYARAEA